MQGLKERYYKGLFLGKELLVRGVMPKPLMVHGKCISTTGEAGLSVGMILKIQLISWVGITTRLTDSSVYPPPMLGRFIWLIMKGGVDIKEGAIERSLGFYL